MQRSRSPRPAGLVAAIAAFVGAVVALNVDPAPVAADPVLAQQVDIVGPAGSEEFGTSLAVLPNGNFFVVDSKWDHPTIGADVGAVYLYDGSTNELISTTTGMSPAELFGQRLVVLPNGNIVVQSPLADIGGLADSGAVVWIDAGIGLNQAVSETNSIHGSTAGDRVGDGLAFADDSDYIIQSSSWTNPAGPTPGVGAFTWADGETGLMRNGTLGAVSVTNSLYGTTTDDLRFPTLRVLANGSFVAGTSNWDNPTTTTANVGAITWIAGNGSTVGAIGPTRSLHGTSVSDRIGSTVAALDSGHYVTMSSGWDDVVGAVTNAGAVTWANGTGPTTGPVNRTNSRYGVTSDDLSSSSIRTLRNGHYVLGSERWDHPVHGADVGLVAWGSGSTPTAGPIDETSGFHGTTPNDKVGDSVRALENGDYYVVSKEWDDSMPATVDVGAVTWGAGDGSAPDGEVSAANSIIGISTGDMSFGAFVIQLTGGDLVVSTSRWDNPTTTATDAGAMMWTAGDGSGPFGPMTTANTLHGTSIGDQVGNVIALPNGGYIASTTRWDDPAAGRIDVGAVTWASGDGSTVGPVTTANSVHGTSDDDRVGLLAVLTGGDFVVGSTRWDDPAGPNDVGAAMWIDGDGPTSGPVTTSDSVHGSSANDQLGSVYPASNGNYFVFSRLWDDPAGNADVGVVRWAAADGSTVGPATTANSLYGPKAGDEIGRGNFPPMVETSAGDVIIQSNGYDDGALADAGASTIIRSDGPTAAPVSAANSAIGTPPGFVGAPFGIGPMTSGDTMPIRTRQNRVLILAADRPPTFAASPSNIEVATAPGDDDVVVAYPTPTATDDRTAVSVACSPASGSAFPVGNTAVTCTASDVAGLTATASFTVTVQRTAVVPDTVPPEPTPVPDIVPLEPARFLDTRPDDDTIDAVGNSAPLTGRVGAGTEIELPVAGRGAVPADAVGVVMNITAINPANRGFVTVHPCGERPLASSLNYPTAGAVVGNEIIAKLSTTGAVCVYTFAETHLTADVVGYVPIGSKLISSEPARLLDSRPGEKTVDGVSAGEGPLQAGKEIVVQIAGRAGIPGDAKAAVLNVTAINPGARGFLTVHPCGDRPLASSLNYSAAGTVVGNEIITKLSATGSICVFTSAATHLSIDVGGNFPADAPTTPLAPARFVDTRTGETTIDGTNAGDGQIPAGGEMEIQVAGRGLVPSAANAAVMNVTAINPAGGGFLTIHPCGERPLASSLNYSGGGVAGNEIVAKLSTTGKVCVYSFAQTHVTVDIVGYVTN